MAGLKICLLLSTNAGDRRAVARGRAYSSYAPATLAVLAGAGPLRAERPREDGRPCRQRIPDICTAATWSESARSLAGRPLRTSWRTPSRATGVTVLLAVPIPPPCPEEARRHADARSRRLR